MKNLETPGKTGRVGRYGLHRHLNFNGVIDGASFTCVFMYHDFKLGEYLDGSSRSDQVVTTRHLKSRPD